MPFTSIGFLFFIIPVVLIYWRLPQKHQSLFLLAASYFFVAVTNFWFAISLAMTTIVTYLCARQISQKKYSRFFFVLGLLFLFGQLIISKYLGLFGVTGLNLIVPLGLSFYTFQTAGYLIDLFTGKSTLDRSPSHFALFVSFFPILTSGPIERGDHFISQMRTRHTFEYSRVVSGLELFTFGLFKKLVIADNLGVIVDKVFSSLHFYRGLSLVIAVVFFSWQLYYDFSGYSDMARGIARILGFDIAINFRTPYLSTSVQDFWRKWHISLSSWFRDYLYFPLGGSRRGAIRTSINVCIVFTLCGLWHGAAITFIVWGALHGLTMTLERFGKSISNNRIRIPVFFSFLYTYCAVTVSWIFFRSATLADAIYILRNALTGASNFIRPSYVFATMSQLFDTNRVEMAIVGGLFVVGAILELCMYRYTESNPIKRLPVFVRFALYTIMIVAILMLRQANIAKFIYVQF